MSRCQVCGTAYADTARHCAVCGADVGDPPGEPAGSASDDDVTPVGGVPAAAEAPTAVTPGVLADDESPGSGDDETPTDWADDETLADDLPVGDEGLPVGDAGLPVGDDTPVGALAVTDDPEGAYDPGAPTPPAGEPPVPPEPPPPDPGRHHVPTLGLVLGLVSILVVLGAIGYGVMTRFSPKPSSTKNPKLPSSRGTVRSPRSHHPPSTSTTQPKTGPTTTTTSGSNAQLSALARQDASGIVSIAAATCNGTGEGSGFLVSPTLVLTNAHIVDGAVAIGLTSGGTTRTGQVIGEDESADVALIHLSSPLAGHVFSFGAGQVSLGTPVGVVGYLSGGSLRMVPGLVGTDGQSISNAGQTRSGLMQTNATVSPGEAGGPVLATDGSLVGLADTAMPAKGSAGYIVPGAEAAPLLASWEQNPAYPPPPSCPHPIGPGSPGPIHNTATGADVPGVLAALTAYFDDIDAGNYAGAYAQLGPETQSSITEPVFATRDATTYDYNVDLQSVSSVGLNTDVANVSFISLQDALFGPNGTSCDDWTLQYTMIKSGNGWLIDGASGLNGVTAEACPS